MKRVARAALVASAFTMTALAPHFARADDTLAAEAAFAEGRELMKEHRYAEACPKLEASYKLAPALGTLMNLAECLRETQHTASAWLHYREAAAMALRQAQPEREKIARDRAAELEPSLCRVLVRRGSAPLPDGLVVARDGERVDEAMLDVAVPTDPGKHTYAFSAPSRNPRAIPIEVVAPEENAACKTIEIDVPTLDSSLQMTHPGVDPPAPSIAPWRAQHTWAIVAASAGVVAFGVGTVFTLSASSMKSEANAACTSAGCPGPSITELHSAGRAADVATVLFVAGAAALTTGAVLWILSPSLKTPSQVAFRF